MATLNRLGLNLTNFAGVTMHGATAMVGRIEGLVKCMQGKAIQENICFKCLKAVT
jgi:hypothetical protein